MLLRSPVVYLLLLLCLTSCIPDKEVEFKSIEKISLGTVGGKLGVTAIATFFNPNSKGVILKKINVAVFLNGKEIGVVSQDYDLKISPKHDFSVPLQAQVTNEEGILNSLGTLFGQTENKIKFVGWIRLKSTGVRINIRVNYEKTIETD